MANGVLRIRFSFRIVIPSKKSKVSFNVFICEFTGTYVNVYSVSLIYLLVVMFIVLLLLVLCEILLFLLVFC